MVESTDRLERYLAERTDESVDERLSDLEALARRAAPPPADRETLRALSNGTRQRLVRALVLADRQLCVCELHPLVDVGESAVSHALAELRAAGLVRRRDEGRRRLYASTERAERLVETLAATREAVEA